MGHKDFEGAKVVDEDGPTFTVAGRKFTCLASPPMGHLVDVLDTRKGSNFWSFSAMDRFIRGSLRTGDENLWDEVTHTKPPVIDASVLGDVFEYLIEEYFMRPTQRPSGSPDGPTATEATSTDDSPSPADEASTSSTTGDS